MKFTTHNDNAYFDSYADIAVHEEMLSDEVRTNTYRKAIFSCGHKIRDKVNNKITQIFLQLKF